MSGRRLGCAVCSAPRSRWALLLVALALGAGWSLLGCGPPEIEPSPCGLHWPSYDGIGRNITVGATTPNDDGYAFSCGGAGAPDWAYEWTADVTGDYLFDTSGSHFDTVLGLMNQDCSVELACDDNGYPLSPGLSQIIMPVEAGQTYIIIVDGANGEAGGFAIHKRPLASPGP